MWVAIKQIVCLKKIELLFICLTEKDAKRCVSGAEIRNAGHKNSSSLKFRNWVRRISIPDFSERHLFHQKDTIHLEF